MAREAAPPMSITRPTRPSSDGSSSGRPGGTGPLLQASSPRAASTMAAKPTRTRIIEGMRNLLKKGSTR